MQAPITEQINLLDTLEDHPNELWILQIGPKVIVIHMKKENVDGLGVFSTRESAENFTQAKGIMGTLARCVTFESAREIAKTHPKLFCLVLGDDPFNAEIIHWVK